MTPRRSVSLVLLLPLLATPAAGATPIRIDQTLTVGGAGNDLAHDITIDPAGELIIVGSFEGSADFGGGALASAGGSDIFVARYDRDFQHIWSRRFGGTGNDRGFGVCTRSNGNILVAGLFHGSFVSGGFVHNSAGGSDALVIELNPGGTHVWSTTIGGVDGDVARDVAADKTGRFFVAGTQNMTAASSQVLLVQYRSDNTRGWSKNYTGTGNATATDAVNRILFAERSPNGSLYAYLTYYDAAGGWLQQRADGTSEGMDVAVNADNDRFVAVSHVSGLSTAFRGPDWGRSLGSLGAYRGIAASGIAAAPHGDIVGTGYYSGTLYGTGIPALASDGDSTDAFVVCYRPDGNPRWALRIGGPERDAAHRLAATADGDYYVTGEFRGSADFGGASRTSAGGSDLFVVRLTGVDPLLQAIDDVPNDQGGAVKLTFDRSRFDHAGSSQPVVEYDVYRRDGAVWTSVRTVPAHIEETCRVIVPTLQDAVPPGSMAYSVYRVRAKTADPGVFYDSPPDSGYSLDNLAPAPPLQLVIQESVLSWVAPPNTADLAGFVVYGSASGILDASTVRIAATAATSLDVSEAPHAYYFVTAADHSGNESAPVVVRGPEPGGNSIRGPLQLSAHPNPFNPEITIRYDVPLRGRVTLDVFDVRGIRVTTLFDGVASPGAHAVTWAGIDRDGKPVASGVYFVRLTHEEQIRVRRIVLLK